MAPRRVTELADPQLVGRLSDVCVAENADRKLTLMPSQEAVPIVSALLGVLAPKVIDRGVTLISNALTKAAGKQEERMETVIPGFLYAWSDARAGIASHQSFRCLQVLKLENGRKWEDFAAELHATLPDVVPEVAAVTSIASTRTGWAAAGPTMFAEFRLSVSPDGSAFEVVPTILYFGRPLRRPDMSSPRSLCFALSFTGPDGQAFASTGISFPKLKPGSVLGPELASRFRSGWIPYPSPAEDVTNSAANYAVALKQPDPPTGPPRLLASAQPYNVAVTAVEARDPVRWLEEVATLISESKTDLSAALQKEVIPSKREEAVRTELLATLGLEQALQLALMDVEAASKAYESAKQAGSDEIGAKKRALVESRYKANEAAIRAGKAKPFADVFAGL